MKRHSSPLFRAAAILAAIGPVHGHDAFTPARERMVKEQIQHRGIRNQEVLRVMRATPRHLFTPEDVRSMAYDDSAVPIGFGATISQPFIVARMTELLAPDKLDRVLEIGTGSGYQAAILAQLATHVYTVEIVRDLAQSAAKTLRELGYANVTVRFGDGYEGWPEHAPFDRIIVTAAPPAVPKRLLDQLAAGGRLVIPVGSGWTQQLVLIEKGLDGKLKESREEAVIFVPLRHGRYN